MLTTAIIFMWIWDGRVAAIEGDQGKFRRPAAGRLDGFIRVLMIMVASSS
jgi:hypothetical protein